MLETSYNSTLDSVSTSDDFINGLSESFGLTTIVLLELTCRLE
jgi:hypothetical protein